jgi:hypothetical protein
MWPQNARQNDDRENKHINLSSAKWINKSIHKPWNEYWKKEILGSLLLVNWMPSKVSDQNMLRTNSAMELRSKISLTGIKWI